MRSLLTKRPAKLLSSKPGQQQQQQEAPAGGADVFSMRNPLEPSRAAGGGGSAAAAAASPPPVGSFEPQAVRDRLGNDAALARAAHASVRNIVFPGGAAAAAPALGAADALADDTLPQGWAKRFNLEQGQVWYESPQHRSQLEHPTRRALPPGWLEKCDAQGAVYFGAWLPPLWRLRRTPPHQQVVLTPFPHPPSLSHSFPRRVLPHWRKDP